MQSCTFIPIHRAFWRCGARCRYCGSSICLAHGLAVRQSLGGGGSRSTIRVDDQSDELFAVPIFPSDAGVARRDLAGPWNVSTAGWNAASHSQVGATEKGRSRSAQLHLSPSVHRTHSGEPAFQILTKMALPPSMKIHYLKQKIQHPPMTRSPTENRPILDHAKTMVTNYHRVVGKLRSKSPMLPGALTVLVS